MRAQDTRKRRSKKKTFRLIAATVFLFLVAGSSFDILMERKLRALESEIQSKGEPTTLAELDATYPPVPDHENGALVYLRAVELLDTFGEGKEFDPEAGRIERRLEENTYSLETLSQAREYLQERRPVLELAKEALGYTRYRYPIDLSELPDGDWNGDAIKGLYDLTNLLWIQGFVALEDDDWDTFLDCQRLSFDLAHSLQTMPCELNTRGLTIVRDARRLVQRSISTGKGPATLYKKLAPLYETMDPDIFLRHSLPGERLRGTYKLMSYYRGDSPQKHEYYAPFRTRWCRRLRWLPGIGGLARMEVYDRMKFDTDLLDSLNLDWHERYLRAAVRQPFVEQWEFSWRRVIAKADGTITSRRLNPFDMVTWLLHPEMRGPAYMSHPWFHATDWTGPLAMWELEHRSVGVAMLIAIHRKEHGELPRQLSDLDPEVVGKIGGDPFVTNLLQYRVVDGGFLLYSVGDNLIDDGGDRSAGDMVVEFVDEPRVVPEKNPPKKSRRHLRIQEKNQPAPAS